ncbi:MAG: class I SAM-dependent methyltransferase [Mycobacterium sp.]
MRRLLRRTTAKGQITLPAVPGMLEDFVSVCNETFLALGVRYSEEDLDHLRGVLRRQLAEAYSASPRSEIVISYESPYGLTASYNVEIQWNTVEGAYNNWVATREPPLFGTEPDARVWALAGETSDPATFPVLDIGAGTGRNCLALARRGHPVDAVEMTEKFADIIRTEAQAQSLNVRVVQRDVFATDQEDLRRDYRLILLSEVVSDFRNVEQLRRVFELAANCLAPGGKLVFNVFLAKPGYSPDGGVRELGQQCYTTIFTTSEVAAAAAAAALDQIADDSVYDYEKANLPAEGWPPTSWYEGWVSGQDVFDLPRDEAPIEMRWLVFRKAD